MKSNNCHRSIRHDSWNRMMTFLLNLMFFFQGDKSEVPHQWIAESLAWFIRRMTSIKQKFIWQKWYFGCKKLMRIILWKLAYFNSFRVKSNEPLLERLELCIPLLTPLNWIRPSIQRPLWIGWWKFPNKNLQILHKAAVGHLQALNRKVYPRYLSRNQMREFFIEFTDKCKYPYRDDQLVTFKLLTICAGDSRNIRWSG